MSTSEHEVVTVDQPRAVAVANPLDMDVTTFSAALVRRGENRRALMQWVRESLVAGVDYGRIHVVGKNKCSAGNQCTNPHHFSKDVLFKPGAEKICGMLGVNATFPTLADYEQSALKGVELKQIILRCHIVDANDRVVAHGVGGRSLETDYGDLNKALKMAEKSAHIDATLRMAGLSEVFTQDLDQMQKDGKIEGGESENPEPPKGDGSDKVPSGKHRGKKWIEVGEDYLQWAIGSEKAPAALRQGCQKELDRRDRERTAGIDGDEKIPH